MPRNRSKNGPGHRLIDMENPSGMLDVTRLVHRDITHMRNSWFPECLLHLFKDGRGR
jgi:hypothetical protein